MHDTSRTFAHNFVNVGGDGNSLPSVPHRTRAPSHPHPNCISGAGRASRGGHLQTDMPTHNVGCVAVFHISHRCQHFRSHADGATPPSPSATTPATQNSEP